MKKALDALGKDAQTIPWEQLVVLHDRLTGFYIRTDRHELASGIAALANEYSRRCSTESYFNRQVSFG